MGRMAGNYKHDDDILRLRGLRLDRLTIAERLGISTATVTQCMKRYGLKCVPRHKPWKAIRSMDRPVGKRAFSIMLMGDQEVFKVMPTSREQHDRLLAMLQAEGGEII